LRFDFTITFAFVAFAVLSSYLLAHLKEPQSVWLWRDMLGVLP
jgi:hypothetical protein